MVQPATSKLKTPPKTRKTAQEPQEHQSATVDKVGYETPPQNSPEWLEFVRGLSLVEALCMAQSEMPAPEKDKTAAAGTAREHKYSSLHAVLKAAKPPLNKYGIFFTQSEAIGEDGKRILATIVMKGDEVLTLSTTILVDFLTKDQDKGMHLTYQRRYQAASALGLAADEDDPDLDGVPDRPDYMQGDKPTTDDGKAQAERDAYAAWVDKKEEIADKISVAKSAGITAQEIAAWVKTNIGKGQNDMSMDDMEKVIAYLSREIKDAAPVLEQVYDEEIDI